MRAPRATTRARARALIGWTGLGASWLLGAARDWLRGEADLEQRAARLCAQIQRRGGAACAVARQFSWRIDLMPVELALGIGELDDGCPPPPIGALLAEVEAAIQGPLSGAFRVIDPEPVASTVLRCTLQAELLDGTAVLIHVRPPGAAEAVAAELAAINRLGWWMELLTVVRPGVLRYLEVETNDLLAEELDARAGARAQNVFRARLKRDGIRFVEAPRVFSEWTSASVCVTEAVSGPTVGELIDVLESGDAAARHRMEAAGIDLEEVAQALQQLCWWELIENIFFHSEPHPETLVVLPGNRLVCTHFSDTTTTHSRNRRLLRDLYRRLDRDDVSGAADVLMQFLSPLPFVDVHDMQRRIEARLWHHLFALRDPDARWWERTSAALWAALLDTTRAEGVPVHLDVIRLARSLLMYEAMALRLHGQLQPLKQFRRYQKRADQRVARHFRRRGERMEPRDLRNALTARIEEGRQLLDRAAFYVDAIIQNLPITRLAIPRKAAYVTIVLLQHGTIAAAGVLLSVAAALLSADAAPGQLAETLPEVLPEALLQPALLILLAALAVSALRRVLFRLGDAEVD